MKTILTLLMPFIISLSSNAMQEDQGYSKNKTEKAPKVAKPARVEKFAPKVECQSQSQQTYNDQISQGCSEQSIIIEDNFQGEQTGYTPCGNSIGDGSLCEENQNTNQNEQWDNPFTPNQDQYEQIDDVKEVDIECSEDDSFQAPSKSKDYYGKK